VDGGLGEGVGVDAHFGADGYVGGVEAVAGGVGLGRDGLVEEGEADASLGRRASGGGRQIGDDTSAGGLVGEDVRAAGLGEGVRAGRDRGDGSVEGAGQVRAAAGGQGGDVGAVGRTGSSAGGAEAQAEQPAGQLAVVLQAALVVVAVDGALVVEGLGAQRGDRVPA
jgi:hypothetical protein